ncbi:SRPBCC family protein [Janibacter cremeus]|uniref:SRPBCC family protein n=1 Tax=Janibacter cremeus TaxID=1285192 RepID=UPI0023F6E83A|nr:SRPBCC family protein [Janibacter cremeus]WEV77106.1 SRPBCC family protein [Janibacter cremeus]
MTTTNAPLLETETEIAAPPEAVWAVITDPRALGGLSDQVMRTHVVGTAPVGLGTRTVNINRRGPLVWPTRAKVVRFDPVRDYAFRIKDNASTWSFELAPTATGTRVVHRREAPNGTTKVSRLLQEKVLGGVADFDRELTEGMAGTLQRLKVLLESN